MPEIVRKITLLPLIALFLCLSSVTVYSAEAPVEVTAEKNAYGTGIRIQAIVDTVSIQGIKLNRGNTKPVMDVKFPKVLKYGQALLEAGFGNVREIEVQTDQGTWTFTFK